MFKHVWYQFDIERENIYSPIQKQNLVELKSSKILSWLVFASPGRRVVLCCQLEGWEQPDILYDILNSKQYG